MTIASRVLNLSQKKQTLIANRLRSDFGLLLTDDLRTKRVVKDNDLVQVSAKRERGRDGESQLQGDKKFPETGKNSKRLVAYIALNSKRTIRSDFEISGLQDFLRNKLPGYMIPSSFTLLEKLPRNSNGKIDYHVLPNPNPENTDSHSRLDFPRTSTERELKNIWSLALGIDQIGIHDNFFKLGGHSLLVARIVSQIRTVFGVMVAMRTLFEYPTLATLSQAIDTLIWAKNEKKPNSNSSQSDREDFEL